MKKNLPSTDLEHILQHTQILWEALRDQRIFITGGTGFFGCWLLESFIHANLTLNLNATAVVLTRDRSQFKKKCPHLYHNPALSFQEGDIRTFDYPTGDFAYIIHAATDANINLNQNNPTLMFDTIVQGTEHILKFAQQCHTKGLLFTSSGAVYGKQPPHVSHLSEDDFQPSDPLEKHPSAYTEGKREAERLCSQYAKQYQIPIKIARCFAFIGPHLPLDAHFAIGNFILDGLKQRPITLHSDGSAHRSYLYAADLTLWLWTILFKGETMRPYNVGSDHALSIKTLATLVSSSFSPPSDIQIKQTSSHQDPVHYVPNIDRARVELKLVPHLGLKESIESTKKWYKS